jgi:hypothetical protein
MSPTAIGDEVVGEPDEMPPSHLITVSLLSLTSTGIIE